MSSGWFVLPGAVLCAGFGVLLWVLRGLRARHRQRQPAGRPGDDFSKAPGESLLLEIDRVNTELNAHRVCLVAQPLLWVAVVVVYRIFVPSLHFQFLMTSLAAGAVVVFYCLWHLARGLRRRRRLKLNYEGEVAVGRALEQLIPQSYHVFHDFPADGFNIDHVLVGPKGVFAVETQTRSKPGDRTDDATVSYNGHALFFPDGADENTVGRTERHAEWLSNWLGSTAGETVAARGIVAVPGWFVKRTTSEGLPVVNPKQFASLFEHIKPRPLDAGQISRIVHELRQRCRVAEPSPEIPQVNE